jgi:ATP-dependent RNA helicase DeaD
VHRIGRTGRIGRSGRAFSLVAGREIYKLQSIQRFTRTKIPRRQAPSLEQLEEKRTNAFFERIRTTLQEDNFQKEARIVDRFLEQGFSATDIACALVHEFRKEGAWGTDRTPKNEQPGLTERPAPHKRQSSGSSREFETAAKDRTASPSRRRIRTRQKRRNS